MTIICNNFCLICVKRAGGQEDLWLIVARKGRKNKKCVLIIPVCKYFRILNCMSEKLEKTNKAQ